MLSNKDIQNYIIKHSDNEDAILKELDRETHLTQANARMISGHMQGLFLTMIAKMVEPKNILEIGTYTGYSAICLAKGLQPNGKLITIDRNDELQSISSKYFKKSGLEQKIIQKVGSAIDIIPTLSEQFDLVFIDADKREYIRFYELIFPKLKHGGYIIVDNTLWSGKVVEEINPKDEQTQGVVGFNKMIANDNRIEKILLPLRDGVTLIRKK